MTSLSEKQTAPFPNKLHHNEDAGSFYWLDMPETSALWRMSFPSVMEAETAMICFMSGYRHALTQNSKP